jgi:ribosomal protein L37AE/L43A
MPVNIHGKSYNTVAERIISAGKDLLSVETQVLFQDPVVIKATITTPKGSFSGISAANPSKTMEKESPYEVAETSAVGRALAFAGYETTNGISSAEEVRKATSSVSNTPRIGYEQNNGEVCPKCKSKLVFATTPAGKNLWRCSASHWDATLKKNTGCDFVQWINEDTKQPFIN